MNSCRTSLARLAPVASRIAISRWRATPRDNSRFAALAQATTKSSADEREQDSQGLAELVPDAGKAARSRFERRLPAQELRSPVGWGVRVGRRLEHRWPDALERDVGLLAGQPVAQASHEVEPRARRLGERPGILDGRSEGSLLPAPSPAATPKNPGGATPTIVNG